MNESIKIEGSEVEIPEDEREPELTTFEEIYANLALNGECHLTIPAEYENSLKVGLKNLKARQVSKAKSDGIVPPTESFAFSSKADPGIEGFLIVKIILSQKAAIPVLKMHIPENFM